MGVPPRRLAGAFALLAWAVLALPVPAQMGIRDEALPKETPKALNLSFQKPTDGTVEVSADEQDWIRDVSWVGIGSVVVKYGSITLRADQMRIDLGTTDVDGEGNVILDQGPNRISGAKLQFNLTTKLGHFVDARADLDPTYHFTGRILEKVGPSSYVFEDGVFTSCTLPRPGWSFSVARGEFTIGEYATLHGTAFRVQGLPLLYLPYMVWPIRSERTTGLLVPNIGYNSRHGAYLGNAFYEVLGPSADATLFLDTYSKGYVGLGAEYRQAFPGGGIGEVLAYEMYDVLAEEHARDEPEASHPESAWKYTLRARHQELPGGLRLLVEAFDFSDTEFFRDFERKQSLLSLRQTQASGALSKDVGPLTLNLRAGRRKEFFGDTQSDDNRKVFTRIPGLELRSRPLRIGRTPLYVSLLASADRLERESRAPSEDGTTRVSGSYERLDLFPRLTAGFSIFPWLSFSPEVGVRETWYSRSAGEANDWTTGALLDRSVERRMSQIQGSIVGPSFQRIYDVAIGPFTRFKHIVEPRFVYRRSELLGDEVGAVQPLVPRFDEVDQIACSNRVDTSLCEDGLRVGLVNRLLAKEGKPGASAREVASLEVARYYDLGAQRLRADAPTVYEEYTKPGPFVANLRVSPGTSFSLSGTLNYEAEDPSGLSGVTSTTFTGMWTRPTARAGVSWSGNHPLAATGTTTGNVRFFGLVPIVPKVVNFDWSVIYDLNGSQLKNQRYLVEIRGSCWSLFLEFLEDRYRVPRRRDYRLAVNLRDVGTFFDVSGGLDSLPF